MAKYTRILSIDGGGVRGLVSGRILMALEQRLRKLSGNDRMRLSDCFDLIAGTGSGGMLACALLCPAGPGAGRPRFSAEEAGRMLLEQMGRIYDTPVDHSLFSAWGLADSKYPGRGLDQVLDHWFEDIELAQLLKPCLVTGYDIGDHRPMLFTTHGAVADPEHNFLVREVCRATSATPTYFDAALIYSETGRAYPMVDGAVFANNPALCAWAEAQERGAELFPAGVATSDMVVVSVGAGRAWASYPYEKARKWGKLAWAQPLLDLAMAGGSETVDFQMTRLFATAGASGRYVRIDPQLTGVRPALDDISDGNIHALLKAGDQAATAHEATFGQLAELLLA